MQFLNPIMLLSLVSLGPLVVIYMLRNKYKNVDVPSNYIWSKLMEKSSDIKKIQKFKKSLLFFIQCLVLIIGAFIMAKLNIAGGFAHNKPVLVIVDNSISASSDIRKFNDSIGYVESYLDQEGIEFYELAVFSDVVNVLEYKEISDIEVTEKFNEYEALDLFIQKQKLNYDIQMILFTDDTLDPIEDVRIVKYPSSEINLALSGYSIENNELVVQVTNYSHKDIKDVEVDLFDESEISNYTSIDIASESTRSLVFSLEDIKRGNKLRVYINIEDDVYFDNEIYLYSPGKEVEVLIVDYDNPFLISALESIGCSVLSTDKYSGNIPGVDYVIFHGNIPEKVENNIIVIDYHDKDSNKISSPRVFKYSIESEVLKYNGECVVYNGRTFNKGIPLIKDDKGFAAYYEIQGRYKNVYFGFDFDETDLIIKPGFIMVLDSILNGDDIGNRYRNTLSRSVNDLNIKDEKVFEEETGKLVEDSFLDQGFYQIVSSSGEDRYVSVNVIDEMESSIFSSKKLSSGERSNSIENGNKDLSNILILLMLIIILIEWWLYYNECKV